MTAPKIAGGKVPLPSGKTWPKAPEPDPAHCLDEDRPPRCPSCLTAFSAHDGLIHTCRRLVAAHDALREIARLARLNASHDSLAALAAAALKNRE